MFFFSFLYLSSNSGCCFYRWVSGWVFEEVLHVPLYSCVWAGASRRAEETLQSQVGRGKTRTAFLWPQQLSEVLWVQTPWETRLVRFKKKCFLERWLLSVVIRTGSHVAALLTWLVFCFGFLVWRAVGVAMTAGSGPWQFCCRNLMSREHWWMQEKEGCGLFFPFLCNLKHWSLPAASVLCHFRKTEIMLFLAVLCLVLDGYNCEVSPVCNFGFKTTFVLTGYFLCLGQCCKFCAMKGETLDRWENSVSKLCL